MKKETMSVHRALAELKLIDDKTAREIQRAQFAAVKKVTGKTVNGFTTDDFKTKSMGSLQSVKDLMARRTAIKSALVLSNATTQVEVAGDTMTVAEAIDRKNTTATMVSLINKLKQTYSQIHQRVNVFNEKLDEEALLYFQEITQNKDKLNDSAFKSLVNAYKEEREQEVVEGFNVLDEYIVLEDSLNEFLTNVDYVLSESNTETKITFEY